VVRREPRQVLVETFEEVHLEEVVVQSPAGCCDVRIQSARFVRDADIADIRQTADFVRDVLPFSLEQLLIESPGEVGPDRFASRGERRVGPRFDLSGE